MSYKKLIISVVFLTFSLSQLGKIFSQIKNFEIKIGGQAMKISSIIIYPDRALINKVAKVKLRAGENNVKFSGLTSGLENNSVQIEIKSGKSAKIADVKVEETFLEKVEVEKLKELSSELNNLKVKRSELFASNEAVKNKLEILKRINPFQGNQKATRAEIENYLKFFEKNYLDGMIESVRIEKEIAEIDKKIKDIENEIKKIESRKETSKTISVDVLCDDEEEVEFLISYIVHNSDWSPSYEIRANTVQNKTQLNFFAVIRQFTGEDWNDVPVEITTSKPAIYGKPPELLPWYVDVREVKRFVKEVQRMPMLEAREEVPVPFIVPEVEEQPTSFSFKLAQKISVPSDDQPHKIFLATDIEDTRFDYFAVPKLSRFAYLKTSLKNKFPFVIIPGEASVFLDGKFVATTRIGQLLPDDTMDIFLGVDESIKVERTLVKKFTEYTGTFTKNKKISYEYKIEISNGKRNAIEIEVRDAFPVSRNEKIKVFREAPSEKGAEISDDGLIKWRIKLGPGEAKSLPLKFYVEFPKDLPVAGLE